MADIPVIAAVEVVKLLVRTILEFVKASNMSNEELQAVWNQTVDEFNKADPNNLPDV